MKKILFIIMLMFIFTGVVNAEGLSFEFKEVNGKVSLSYYFDNELIDYEVAVNDYGVMRYQTFKYNGRDVYFYNGDEIKESIYLKGKATEDADLRALKEEEFKVIRVHDTNEFIDAVESIYTGKVNGRYKLIYSKYEYEDFSMYKIKRYYKNNILTDIDTNMYKFDEYGILFPTRFIPVIGEEETIVNFNNVMISDLELNYVKEFSEYFKTLLKDKSDYEKVLGIYTYIKDTAEYVSDDGYEEMDNAFLSPYDVLFDKKMVCIGAATTFQYLAEELGLKSYIVDRVVGVNEDESYFATSHTYNVVKLDGRWYIVDIAENKFLVVKDDSYSKDNYSKYIRFGKENYTGTGKVTFDYNAIDQVISDILGIKKEKVPEPDKEEEKTTQVIVEKEDKEEVKDNSSNKDITNKVLKYVLVILILILVFIVVVITTK